MSAPNDMYNDVLEIQGHTIPIPSIATWEKPRRLIDTECSRGQSLDSISPDTLTQEDIKRIADQLHKYLVLMRTSTSPVMEGFDG